jgi:hypothetical protein
VAERSLIQYQPITGPVWSEPVASRLAWLPQGREFARGLPPNRLGDFAQPSVDAIYKPARLEWTPTGQQPARNLPPNKLGDFARPEFEALYKPERLQWVPAERYFGRAAPRGSFDYSFLVQLVTAAAYDPQTLGWLPSERYYGRAIAASPKLFQGFALVGPAPAYDPQRLEWIPSGRAPQPPLELRRLGDFQQPGFDSIYKAEALQWQPRGKPEPLPPETRRLGDFQQPQFAASYKSEGLQWFPADRYYGKSLARALNDWSVLVQLVTVVAYDPKSLEWQPRDRYFGILPARALVDWSVYQGDPIIAPVVPPAVGAPVVVSSGMARRLFGPIDWSRFEKKKKQARKKSRKAVELIEELAGRSVNLSTALETLGRELRAAEIKEAKVYRDLLQLEMERKVSEQEADDEEVILLLMH